VVRTPVVKSRLKTGVCCFPG